MKKRVLLGATLLSMLVLGASCNKEEVKPDAAVLYPSTVIKMGLDIHVTASSTAARIGGLSGATVTVKQNGKTYTATTDASGIASFGDLTEGSLSYYISASGFASVNDNLYLEYNGSLNLNGTNGNSTSGSSVAQTGTQTTSDVENVTLHKLGSSVSGFLLADLDGDGNGLTKALTTGTVVLTLDDTSIEPNVFTANVGTTGLYTFSNLPENVDYSLSTQNINIKIAENGVNPEHLLNTNFPSNKRFGTTLQVGQTDYKGVITLQ